MSLLRRIPLRVSRRPIVPRLSIASVRYAANSVSGKPPSDNLPHFVQNVKEESSHATSALAEAIAGGKAFNQFESTTKDAPAGSFVDLTASVASAVPTPIMRFGLAGALPYVGTGASSVYYAYQAGQVGDGLSTSMDMNTALTLMNQALELQVTYGAVLLSFIGALHWGMEFAALNGHKGGKRLALGVAPVLVGWSTLALDPTMALVVQWVGFTGMWYADLKATTHGWTPKWYSQYRFYLSVLVGTCILGTLAGTSKFGPTLQHSELRAEAKKLRKQELEKTAASRQQVVAPGEIGSVSGVEENADAYVLIRHAKEEEDKDKDKKQASK